MAALLAEGAGLAFGWFSAAAAGMGRSTNGQEGADDRNWKSTGDEDRESGERSVHPIVSRAGGRRNDGVRSERALRYHSQTDFAKNGHNWD